MTASRRELLNTIRSIRALAGDMTLARLQTLLVIAEAGDQGISLTEVSKRGDLLPSNTSKQVRSWSKLNARKQPGPGFVVAEADDMDLSTKICRLTPKGKTFLREVFKED